VEKWCEEGMRVDVDQTNVVIGGVVTWQLVGSQGICAQFMVRVSVVALYRAPYY